LSVVNAEEPRADMTILRRVQEVRQLGIEFPALAAWRARL
jgi:hypothetical protein